MNKTTLWAVAHILAFAGQWFLVDGAPAAEVLGLTAS